MVNEKKKYVIIGTGGRGCETFGRTIINDYADCIELAGLYERFALFVDRESFGLVDREKIIAAKRDPGYQLTCTE